MNMEYFDWLHHQMAHPLSDWPQRLSQLLSVEYTDLIKESLKDSMIENSSNLIEWVKYDITLSDIPHFRLGHILDWVNIVSIRYSHWMRSVHQIQSPLRIAWSISQPHQYGSSYYLPSMDMSRSILFQNDIWMSRSQNRFTLSQLIYQTRNLESIWVNLWMIWLRVWMRHSPIVISPSIWLSQIDDPLLSKWFYLILYWVIIEF